MQKSSRFETGPPGPLFVPTPLSSDDKSTRSSEIEISKRTGKNNSFSKVKKAKISNVQENSLALQMRAVGA